MSQNQKGKTNLDCTKAKDSEWQWHQLGHMKSAPRSRQTTTPAPHHSGFYRPFLPPNQQRQSSFRPAASDNVVFKRVSWSEVKRPVSVSFNARLSTVESVQTPAALTGPPGPPSMHTPRPFRPPRAHQPQRGDRMHAEHWR